MNKAKKAVYKYDCLFKSIKDPNEMIYVHFEDLDGGYIHYEHSNDCTRQVYTMTKTQLLNNYERLH
ncbi:hypothetical protein DOE73_21810 [Paenibacillus dendritiformis]|nr:hypothetical protein DOE73_21810 [Paenibacillus dendritiformis]